MTNDNDAFLENDPSIQEKNGKKLDQGRCQGGRRVPMNTLFSVLDTSHRST